MIPLRDVNPSRGTPYVNYSIIAVCALLFLYELQLGRHLNDFLLLYGLVPYRYSNAEIAAHFTLAEQITPFFSSMFLHGGWMHLIGNMWVLYIFGDNLEGRLGHVRYFIFYILCGLVAASVHLVTNFSSQLPTIGASGAVAGVMGAYFILYPRAKVLTLVVLFFFIYFAEVPAYVFLGFWFVLQFFSGATSLLNQSADAGGVAWWAHAGGFLGGIFLLSLFKATTVKRKWGE